jgi:alkaline phosphatase D
MKRREFLSGVGAITAASIAPKDTVLAADVQRLLKIQARSTGLSILQGVTTETTTQLAVDVPVGASVIYELVDQQTGLVFPPSFFKSTTFGRSPTRVDKVHFAGLNLGAKYKFTVRNTSKRSILDERFLSTVDLNKINPRIALMSCMNDGDSAMAKIWTSAEAANLDYLFFVGDCVYADTWFTSGPDVMWKRFVDARAKIPYYRWKNLKPVIAVWDDHDFGKNNETGTYKHKAKTLEIFKTFLAQDDVPGVLMNGDANSRFFRAFNQNFVFFDSRYFRGLADPNNNNKPGFLGQKQIDWATDLVNKNFGPTFVLQGSPVFGRTQKGGSFQGDAPEELESLLKTISGWKSPALFGAGDIHMSEVSTLGSNLLGYQSVELISSCMHSNTRTKFYDNPNLRTNGCLTENFLVLEKTGVASSPTWDLTSIGIDKKVHFSQKLKVA